jgi:hypothetical protein
MTEEDMEVEEEVVTMQGTIEVAMMLDMIEVVTIRGTIGVVTIEVDTTVEVDMTAEVVTTEEDTTIVLMVEADVGDMLVGTTMDMEEVSLSKIDSSEPFRHTVDIAQSNVHLNFFVSLFIGGYGGDRGGYGAPRGGQGYSDGGYGGGK